MIGNTILFIGWGSKRGDAPSVMSGGVEGAQTPIGVGLM